MNQNYKNQCQSIVSDFVLNSTRFTLENVLLDNFSDFIFAFDVHYHFVLGWKGCIKTA